MVLNMNMNIKNGEIFKNKTWKFLLPCFRSYGDSFVVLFNNLFKFSVGIAVGIYDTTMDGTKYAEGKNIYILCNKNSSIYTSFYEYVIHQPYFVYTYCPDADILSSNNMMVVLKFPEKFEKAYDNFVVGNFSKMFSEQEITTLFGDEKRKEERNILTKNLDYKGDFIKKLNKKFNTKILQHEIENLEELELPLEGKDEIFNYNKEEVFLTKRSLLSESLI